MYYILIFAVLCLLSFVYLKLADKLNIIDKPNHRSSHTTPTIRGGGILFLLAMLIYFVTCDFQYPYFIIGVFLIAIISFIDDILTLSSSLRLPFQFLAVGLCLFQIGYSLNDFLVLIPIIVLGVGFINVYNFMDGINGITVLYSIIVLLGIMFINYKENIIDSNLLIYMLLSLLVFGFYNLRKKARMFAGDIGSISIAVLFFFIGVTLIKKLNSPLIVLLVAVYSADAILTIIYRKYIGESLTQPHRHHIYQKLVHALKMSHLKVALIYALIQTIISTIVFYGYKLTISVQYVIILIVSVLLAITYFYVFKQVEEYKNI